MSRLKQLWDSYGRDAAWGVLLYTLLMIALFFIFARGEANFIYVAF